MKIPIYEIEIDGKTVAVLEATALTKKLQDLQSQINKLKNETNKH